ncbi:TonB-dependent receptor [Spirosoma utsteinense]|uniref:Iron complex outermembrane receptor protein/hemoglobin/transferrin/lactoferrin receptor protein n=1 Tax=Spirosoma utsteinense TaxID=2585773 RepID=A0ABR6VZW0_9BACT|nr:TonB-dependent receptor [Spirosoma utsteinense]MBC3786508.1 iron complex outermembrane receptor protein/hemoglobin/transferrin/lactoferrin receptor protein [Spirosoma utsteinense]MBC3789884.1 iron complex outermembrane receptor protein/hemoglobin/transferrin/lactoferrin receptor protein [Spirosoma utsteinense]
MKFKLFTFLFYLIGSFCMAQSLSGIVRDARTNQPLPGVSVRLLSTNRGAVTDQRGYYVLRNLPAGSYTVQLSSVGYRLIDQAVEVAGSSPVERDIQLQPTVIQLNQQTVTTSQRSESPDFLRPEVTTVITARDLRQRAPRTVPEALFGATGVFLQKTNHGGGSPFVRGLTGQQTLLLVDGIRLNNATFRSGPNQYLNTIDPQSVSQIEVVRSSGSVAYGSDAIGGVVNVLTRTPQFSDEAGFTGSAFGKAMTQGMEYSGRAELGYSSATVAVVGALAYRKFGDLVAGRGLGRETPTGYNQLSGDVKARFRLSDRFVATVAYQDLRQDSVPVYHKVRLENFAYNQFNPQRRQLTYARLEGFYNRPLLKSVQLTASWQRQTEGRQSQKNPSTAGVAAPAVYERDETTTTGLTLLATAEPARFWQMQNGIEWYYDRVGSRRDDVNLLTGAVAPKRGLYPDGSTMSSLALFSLHTFTLNRLILTAGGRYNAFRITTPESSLQATIRPSALVGNVGASFAILPAVRLVASVQSAFRAPNVDDLGTLGIVDFRYEVPNASLQPERSLNKEVGVKVRTERFSATVLAYHNQLSNFISRVRAGRDSIQGYPVYLKQNSAQAFIRGLEAEAEYEVAPGWLTYAGGSYTYGQNTTAGEPFRRIPPLNGRAGVTYQPSAGWWARAELLLAGAQTRLAKGDQDDNRIAKGGTPAWQVLNLNGGYRWRFVTLSAELQNLTNEAYRTHGSGVDGIGRSAWLSVLVSW